MWPLARNRSGSSSPSIWGLTGVSTSADGLTWDPAVLQRLLTAQRLSSYTAATGGHLDEALALYEWNMSAAAAVLTTTAMVEVLVRNSLDTQLLRWASRRAASEWFDVVQLDDQGHRDLRTARARAAKRGPEVHGRVVAELTFGFLEVPRSFPLPDVPLGPRDGGGVPPRASGPPPPPS